MPKLRTLLTWCAGLLAAGTIAQADPWKQPAPDLPLDPALQLGTLPNGLRFAVMPNHEPKDHASLRLLVSVGSLYEEDRERGLAHFIEHMAFRGTTKFPRSTLVPALEKMGMGLGPDTAAFTGYDFTVYQLELPDTSPATLQYGLDVLREFAQNITFAPADIVTERGVVLSEMAARDTGSHRWSDYNIGFLWPGSLRALRSPIGTTETLAAFRQPDFKAFYDAWYRPERMAILVVGDLPAAEAVGRVRQTFQDLKPRAPARPEPSNLVPNLASRSHVSVLTDPLYAGVELVMEHPSREPLTGNLLRPDRIRRLRQTLAMAMLQRRLRLLTHRSNASFLEGGAYINYSVPGWAYPVLSVSAKVPAFNRAATEADQEFRRAYLYGFTAEELSEAKAAFRSSFQQLIATAETRPSAALAGQLANLLLYGNHLSAPAAVVADVQEPLEQTTLDECRAAFRELWGADAPHVVVAVNPRNELPPALVAGTMNDARATPVHPLENKVVAPFFPYGDFGPPGSVKERRDLADLGMTLLEFSNGVRVNLKPTPFEAGAVEFMVRVGRGRQSMPVRRGLDLLADAGLVAGGLKKYSSEQIESLLAGHPISMGWRTLNDAGAFYGRASPEELKFALQIIGAYLSDPGFRSEQLQSVRGSVEARLSNQRGTSGGLIDLYGEQYFTGYDFRFVPPAESDVEQRTFSEMEDWLAPELKSGAVEVTLVGDFKLEETIATAAASLGALSQRPPPAPLTGKPVKFSNLHQRYLISSSPAVPDTGVAVYWPASAISTVAQERRCNLLGGLLKERLHRRLRDELGATYTPEVNFVFDQSIAGHNYFMAKVAVSRDHANRTEQIILEEGKALGRAPVDAETFERARAPMLRERNDQLRSNVYWLYTVMADIQQRPERIENARTRATDFASITAADLVPLASQYLRPESAYKVWTAPVGAQPR